MNFAYFEALSDEEAEVVLSRYLATGRAALAEFVPIRELPLDFSPGSIPDLLFEEARALTTTPSAEDASLPAWLRESDSYVQGLYDFDDSSAERVMTLSYYVGECFVRQHGLSWKVGSKNTATEKQPVVGPFSHRRELAPILVTENLLRAVIEGDGIERVQTAVDTWIGYVSSNT